MELYRFIHHACKSNNFLIIMHLTIYYTKSNLNNYVHVDNIIFNLQLIHICVNFQVATGLAERYKSLNKKLAITMTKCQTAFNWRELREDYAILSCIVKKVDDHISPIILLSFANNVYFICLQLLNGLSYVYYIKIYNNNIKLAFMIDFVS